LNFEVLLLPGTQSRVPGPERSTAMAEDKERDAAISRQKQKVAQEVEQHKDESVDLDDLEDVAGGWKISYTTDPELPVGDGSS
jgi:hypothetical protein